MSTETFVIPPRSKVGYLDPEIAGEGERVLLSDGETVTWAPPPVAPVMPDWSGIKSIRKYFNRKGYSVWPAWLYHPTSDPIIVKNAEEAAEIGICYREATNDERARYGVKAVWDFTDECQWRPTPFDNSLKFNSAKPGQGKTVVHAQRDPQIAQNALIEAMIPQVAAAVATALKMTGPAAPAHVDAKQWEEFLAFQAFKKSAEVVNAMGSTNALASGGESIDDDDDERDPEDDRAAWEAEAIRKGIKIDGRWSLDRLKKEIEKAA